MRKVKKVSYKVSLGGIISALSLSLMFLTGFMPFLVSLIPALTGAMLIIVYVEINAKWAFFTYVSVAVLCLFITPDKEAGLLYILLLGYYPLVKMFIEKISNKVLEWIIKLAVYNTLIVIYYQIVIRVVAGSDLADETGEWGKYGAFIFLGLTNIVFIIYDVAVSRLKDLYVKWFRKKILRKI